MTIINETAITQIVSKNKNTSEIVSQLNNLCILYNINTVNRLSMFVAQCLHESGSFRYMSELWGPTKWQILYENHKGLGNVNPGDGSRFRGRGLIQLTGRNNYQAFSNWAQDPVIVNTPEIVATPKYAVLSAIWYWTTNNLNQYADNDDIITCTRKINGKQMLGLEERTKFYNSLKLNISSNS